jgi:hypothetical protein
METVGGTGAAVSRPITQQVGIASKKRRNTPLTVGWRTCPNTATPFGQHNGNHIGSKALAKWSNFARDYCYRRGHRVRVTVLSADGCYQATYCGWLRPEQQAGLTLRVTVRTIWPVTF